MIVPLAFSGCSFRNYTLPKKTSGYNFFLARTHVSLGVRFATTLCQRKQVGTTFFLLELTITNAIIRDGIGDGDVFEFVGVFIYRT